MSAISSTLRKRLRETVELRCAYCHSLESLLGLPLEADHIIPISRGGKTILANLCLACRSCNGIKWYFVKAHDPQTRRLLKLFHPRRQRWPEHFEWSQDGTLIIGRTATGRATVEALQMNNDLIVSLRALWVRLSLHPAE